MKSEESDIIVITDDEAGNRIDKILANRYKEVRSRSYFQYLINEGNVLLDGKSVKKRTRPEVGDEIQILFVLTPEIDVTPEDIPLDIIYEDDDIIVINKPAGMVVHPAPGNWTGTFVNALLYHCKELDATNTMRPGIVHRLDKETTGVLIAAKNAKAQQGLVDQFSSRQVYKEYLAICLGNPGNTTIEQPIGRHPVHRKKMAIVETGRHAKTHVETMACNGKISAVKIILETGRTHQIRVHLKHQGAPVLGDATYGNASSNTHYKVTRQLLHARVLSLKHPVTGEELTFEAPAPSDMQPFLKLCGS